MFFQSKQIIAFIWLVCVFSDVCQLAFQSSLSLPEDKQMSLLTSLAHCCNYTSSLHSFSLYNVQSLCWLHPQRGRSVVAAALERDLCVALVKANAVSEPWDQKAQCHSVTCCNTSEDWRAFWSLMRRSSEAIETTCFSFSNAVLIKRQTFLTQVTCITDRSRTGCVVYADLKYNRMNENEDNSQVGCRPGDWPRRLQKRDIG